MSIQRKQLAGDWMEGELVSSRRGQRVAENVTELVKCWIKWPVCLEGKHRGKVTEASEQQVQRVANKWLRSAATINCLHSQQRRMRQPQHWLIHYALEADIQTASLGFVPGQDQSLSLLISLSPGNLPRTQPLFKWRQCRQRKGSSLFATVLLAWTINTPSVTRKITNKGKLCH